jgi:SAM-dependent methyltransferase
MESDELFRIWYEGHASEYEDALRWIFGTFLADERTVRMKCIDLLEIRPGARVLEVGCGTGHDTSLICESVGTSGSVVATDISAPMLRQTASRSSAMSAPTELVLCNASYLPFPDRSFDATYHFGGVNQFGDRQRALAEMTRVTKVGGKVVVGDEGLAPWQRASITGRVLINANPMYDSEPPLEALPLEAGDVTLRWLLADAFFVIDYRVLEAPARVDYDLPIPGKRDTLRQRYISRFGREPS